MAFGPENYYMERCCQKKNTPKQEKITIFDWNKTRISKPYFKHGVLPLVLTILNKITGESSSVDFMKWVFQLYSD